MGFGLIASTPSLTVGSLPQHRLFPPTAASRSTAANVYHAGAPTTSCMSQTVVRRSGNYRPSIWDYDYLQSLTNTYTDGDHTRRAENLKRNVRKKVAETVMDPLERLQLIDVLQRLGLSYHFKDEIARILESTYSSIGNIHEWKKDNLYATALVFRILRQHGFNVPEDVFSSFSDDYGKLKPCFCEDTKGMLCLYEASYLSMKGEKLLEEAKDFTTRHLRENLEQIIDQSLAEEVRHALELPLHWRMPRLETRWFIDAYEQRRDMDPLLLELAKLDFNMVQAVHQQDLKHMATWWRSTGLAENLSFARDRLMENFFWTVGVNFEPQFGYFRRMATEVNAFVTTIDDIYDVYGTVDELELFTDAIRRWDITATEKLPDYMRMCFLSLYNSVNEMAYDVLKEEGHFILPYLTKMWAELCESYLKEAKWYHSGHTPTLKEYLDNAWVSISAPLILVHAYFFVTKSITKEALECLERYPTILRCSSMVLRLADDLGTSSDELKRGDVPKSIQCYMNETGASEEETRSFIRYLIDETWRKMNEDRLAVSPFSETFFDVAMNLARMAQCMYQYGDGHGVQEHETKDRVLSLLIEPVPCVLRCGN